MSKKIIFLVLAVLVILTVIFSFYVYFSRIKNIGSNKSYSTLKEYREGLNYSCNFNFECKIKDIHDCCGYYPECVNSNAKVDPDFVDRICGKEVRLCPLGVFTSDTTSCKCINKKCQWSY